MNSRDRLASQLAKFLRLNGEKVTSGACKLSLTTSALCLLNTLFADVLFQTENLNSLEDLFSENLREDVKFLFDFMKRTPSLKLFHGMQTLRGGVDLSNFTSLTVLELHKVPAHLIVGLHALCTQLKALICNRSICYIKELFWNCIEEQNSNPKWIELKELNVSHNYLEGFDESLNFLPNVEYFDASHNNLKHVDEIRVLEKLIVVNLSYNVLEHVPILCGLSCYSLKVLYIRNNILEDLSGMECFINLEEFDASNNCFSEHCVLRSLENLKHLKVLLLEGNPLFFHKRHRALTGKYLHPYVLNAGLLLNGKKLLLNEVSPPGSTSPRSNLESLGRHQTSINMIVEDIENNIARSSPEYRSLQNTPSITEEIIGYCENNAHQTDIASQKKICDKSSGSKTSKKKISKKKNREVVIFEPIESLDENLLSSNLNDQSEFVPSLPSHIQAKQLFETRRKEYREEWLIPTHSIQDLISGGTTPKVPTNTPISNSMTNVVPVFQQPLNMPVELFIERLQPATIEKSEENGMPHANSEICGKNVMTDFSYLEVFANQTCPVSNSNERRQSQISDDIEVLSQELDCNESDIFDKNKNDLADCDIYQSITVKNSSASESDEHDMEDDDSEEESEARIFVVERKDGNKCRSVFVNIGDQFIKEKDFLTGKIIDSLDLRSLLSIKLSKNQKEGVNESEVHLLFDTIKSSRQKRFYIFEDLVSAESIVSILQPFADARTLQDTTLGALQCLKCSSQFSKQLAHRKVLKTKKPYMKQESLPASYDSSKGYFQETDLCPNCGSNMVVEMDTFPVPAFLPSANPNKKSNFLSSSPKTKADACGDNVSVDSSSSGSYLSCLFSSTKFSPAIKRKQDSTSERNVNISEIQNQSGDASSSISLDFYKHTEKDQDPCGSTITRNSSDLTIISNQSQGSIIVIPDPEINLTLDAISERESMCSPLPPSPKTHGIFPKINPASTLLSPQSDIVSSGSGSTCTAISTSPYEQQVKKSGNIYSPEVEKNLDFYSITESLGNNLALSTESNELRLNNSEVYHSPNKSDNYQSFTVGPSSLEDNTSAKDSGISETLRLVDLFSEKESVSSEVFSSIDHRLKLHLEISIFGIDEDLEACLETSTVPLTTGEEFKGLFVISSKKVYIMKILNKGESVEKNIKQMHSWPLNQLKLVNVLLGSQGFSVTCGSDSKVFTLLIRDADLCNCFTSYLTDILNRRLPNTSLPNFMTHTKESLDQLNEEILTVHDRITSDEQEELEVLLHLFAFWSNCTSEKVEEHPVCIVVTPSDMFVANVQYKKQTGQNKVNGGKPLFHYVPLEKQRILNLISVQLNEDLMGAELHFVDEDENTNCRWTILTQTKSSLLSCINAFKGPWEAIFGIELPLCFDKK